MENSKQEKEIEWQNKKIETLETEVSTLKEILNKKNKEIIKLKKQLER